MKFRTSAPAVICAAVIGVVTAVSLLSYAISHRMVDEFEKTRFSQMGETTRSKFQDAEAKAISTAETIASMPQVQKAMVEKNRPDLLAATSETFALLKDKYGVRSQNFYFPPAETFLRMNRPKEFGDDVSSYRKLIVEANQAQAIRKGLEITATGISVAGAVPIKNEQGAHIGVMDVGLDPAALLDELKKAYGFELAFFVNEELLRSTSKGIKQDIFSAQNRVGSYIKYAATHPELLQSLVTDSELNITEDAFAVRDSGGISYGVLRQPIYNFTKQPIGVLVVAQDFGQTRAADGQAIVMQALLCGASLVILIGVVLVVVRGYILRPMAALTAHVTALATPDGKAETPSADQWCEEMQQLQSACDRLAQRPHEEAQR